MCGLRLFPLFLYVTFAVSPLRAAVAGLKVCNHGKVTLDVYTAKKWDNLRDTGWQVGSTRVLSGRCEVVYSESVDNNSAGNDADPAYIGFAYTDVRGQWRGGRFAKAPDFGFIYYGPLVAKVKGVSGHQRLSNANKSMCVRKGATSYRIVGDLEVDCSSFHVTDSDRGQWVPLAAAFYYSPIYIRTLPGQTFMMDYLNVAAVATSSLMAAEMGNGYDERQGHSESGESDADAARQLQDYSREQRSQEAAGRRQEYKDAHEEKMRELRARAAAGEGFAKQALDAWERDEQQHATASRQSVAAYKPDWMSKQMIVRGTVEQIKIGATRFPTWVTIYFKESANAAFVVCSYPDLLQENFGSEYRSDLVGKKIEVEGVVSSAMCDPGHASIAAAERRQVRLLGQ